MLTPSLQRYVGVLTGLTETNKAKVKMPHAYNSY